MNVVRIVILSAVLASVAAVVASPDRAMACEPNCGENEPKGKKGK